MTIACQAPLSMGFPKQEYSRGLPCAPPGDLLDPGIDCMSPALTDRFFSTEPPIWGGTELIALVMILVLGYVRQNSYSQKMLAAVLRVDVHEITTIRWFRKKLCVKRGEKT